MDLRFNLTHKLSPYRAALRWKNHLYCFEYVAALRKLTGNGRGRTVAPEPQQPATHDLTTNSLFSFPITPRKPLATPCKPLAKPHPSNSSPKLLLRCPLPSARNYSPHLFSSLLTAPLLHTFQHHPNLFMSLPSFYAFTFLFISCRIVMLYFIFLFLRSFLSPSQSLLTELFSFSCIAHIYIVAYILTYIPSLCTRARAITGTKSLPYLVMTHLNFLLFAFISSLQLSTIPI